LCFSGLQKSDSFDQRHESVRLGKGKSLSCAQLYDKAAQLAIEMKDFQAALRYTREAMPIFSVAYPRHSPMMALQWLQSAKLDWYLENTGEALSAARKAASIMRMCYSTKARLARDCFDLIQQATAQKALESGL